MALGRERERERVRTESEVGERHRRREGERERETLKPVKTCTASVCETWSRPSRGLVGSGGAGRGWVAGGSGRGSLWKKVHTSGSTVRHKMADTRQIQNKMSLVNDTVRHIICFVVVC